MSFAPLTASKLARTKRQLAEYENEYQTSLTDMSYSRVGVVTHMIAKLEHRLKRHSKAVAKTDKVKKNNAPIAVEHQPFMIRCCNVNCDNVITADSGREECDDCDLYVSDDRN
jgi:hypothetical protein